MSQKIAYCLTLIKMENTIFLALIGQVCVCNSYIHHCIQAVNNALAEAPYQGLAVRQVTEKYVGNGLTCPVGAWQPI